MYVGVVRRDGKAAAIFPTRLSPRGRVSLIGTRFGNYGGPVFDPRQLREAVAAWGLHLSEDRRVAAIDLDGARERSPFFELASGRRLPGWGESIAVPTNSCPEIDLGQGWAATLGRHKSKQRSTWRRKAARLERLGSVEFAETDDGAAIEAAMPRMVELWSRRWEGRDVRAGFAENVGFQLSAARALATAGLALLSTLRLDGEIVAFAYGIRGCDYTSSYVLAHDDRFRLYSPGLLLLLRILEAACDRRDPLYDCSLGDAPYKALWMTGEQQVYRMLWGRGRRLHAARSAAWARARSNPALRAIKLRGWRGLRRRPASPATPDDASVPSAAEGPTTYTYELAPAPSDAPALRRCPYGRMRELLSAPQLSLAVERSYRGDELLLVENESEPVGVVWLAAQARRSAIVGDTEVDVSDRDVYYHPAPLPGRQTDEVVDRLGAGIVVTGEPLPRRDPEVSGREIETKAR